MKTRFVPAIAVPLVAILATVAAFQVGSPVEATAASRLECWGCQVCLGNKSVPAATVHPDHTWVSFSYYCPNNPFDVACGWGGCGGFAANGDLDALAMEVARHAEAGDIDSLGDMIAAHSDHVVLTPERQAIQVVQTDYCGANEVYAHVALSESAFYAPAAAAQR